MENIILYNTEDGKASVKLYAENNTVWLTQAMIVELFPSDNISGHTVNIFAEQELTPEATIRNFRTTCHISNGEK